MSVILCTAGYDHTIRFWEAPTAKELRKIPFQDSQVNRLAITPDKQYLAAAGNPHIRLFEIPSENPSPVISYDGHSASVTAVEYQKEGKWMCTASEDGTIKIWDIRAPGCQRNHNNQSPINSACLHPNQAEVITGDQQGRVRVWDLATSKISCELIPDKRVPVRCLAVASDASLLVAGNNRGTVFVWKMGSEKTPQPHHKLEAHSVHVLQTVISPDVRYLVTTSSDKTARVWSAEDFSPDRTLIGHQRWVWDCVISADSAYLVTASSDKTARLWDLSTGESVLEYNNHHKALTCVALNDV